MTDLPQPVVGSRELVYKNQYQETYKVRVSFSDYSKEIFVNSFGQRAGLLIMRDNNALLVRQYRLLCNDYSWEIPGGRVDEKETPEQTAIREGREETNLLCSGLKRLIYFHPGLDTHDNPTFIFFTDQFVECPCRSLSTNEVCDKVWIPLPQCLEMIFSGKIVDSFTISALLAYRTLQDNPDLANK